MIAKKEGHETPAFSAL